MDFLHKLDENIFKDLYWNIPEQKQGKVNIIGGNAQSFRTSVKTAEYLLKNYPLANVNLVLPDILKTKLPPMPDIFYLKSTETGSFADSEELKNVMALADYSLIIGDLSKNTITGQAIASACENSAAPLLVTRDRKITNERKSRSDGVYGADTKIISCSLLSQSTHIVAITSSGR